MLSRIVVCALAVLGVLPAQRPGEHETVVQPLPDENILNPCRYRLVLPAGVRPVRATWVVWDRGEDYLLWFYDPLVRAFAREHRLALILAMQCRSKEREDMIVLPEAGAGRAVLTAIDQFAEAAGHPEMRQAKVIHLGWSGAGSLVARMAGYKPERYLAGIAYAPGQYDPLGMNTIELPDAALQAPQLVIANGADNINGTERPYRYFRRYFERGAPWTFVVQNRTPHCCLQNAQGLILEWLRGVLTVKPPEWRRCGFITAEESEVRDEWKNPVFNVRSARVSSSCSALSPELPAGRLPTPKFAREWLAFEQRPKPPTIWHP